VTNCSVRNVQLVVKYSLDRVVSLLLLLILSPVLLLIAALIKLEDRGPILFVQARAGTYRAPFRIIKFRTMIPNADAYLDSDGRPLCDRVTKVGRFLRRWSLDELPQLVNVVTGDMSIIGPRPVPLEYAERMAPSQLLRFELRPGITGLAQVHGRHKEPWSKRIQWDVEYVENFSLLLDLKIAVLTVRAVLDPETLVDRGDPGKVDI
jgi:lipopolysaccharide/colanic/teichoic acid biosynthesis glycosyltransferase